MNVTVWHSFRILGKGGKTYIKTVKVENKSHECTPLFPQLSEDLVLSFMPLW